MRLRCIQERPKRERIECVCGAGPGDKELSEGKGFWVQCDGCLAWLHAACVALKSPPKGALSVMVLWSPGHTRQVFGAV